MVTHNQTVIIGSMYFNTHRSEVRDNQFLHYMNIHGYAHPKSWQSLDKTQVSYFYHILPHLILTTAQFRYYHYPILQRGKVIWLGWYSVKHSDKSDSETILPPIILSFQNRQICSIYKENSPQILACTTLYKKNKIITKHESYNLEFK